MNPKKCLIGKKFGLLTPRKEVERNDHGNARYLCDCDCGKKKEVWYQHLTTGRTKSCGCATVKLFKQALARKRRKKD